MHAPHSLTARRRIAEEIAANLPEPRKGESIMRELTELRLRGAAATAK
jgi:hypothetical protein